MLVYAVVLILVMLATNNDTLKTLAASIVAATLLTILPEALRQFSD